jgi:rRNA maturation endonuclease Nob1
MQMTSSEEYDYQLMCRVCKEVYVADSRESPCPFCGSSKSYLIDKIRRKVKK